MKTRTERIIAVLQASLRDGARVEFTLVCDTRYWTEIFKPSWDFLGHHYRVSLPGGGTREPITAKDWEGQAVVWVRLTPESTSDYLVTAIHDVGYYSLCNDKIIHWNCGHLAYAPEVYSFDRKTWHPFLREVESGWQVVASTEEGV